MHVDIDAKRGHAEFFMINACEGLAGDKRAAWLVLVILAMGGNPLDHRRMHVFVGTEVEVLWFFPVVNDMFWTQCAIRFAVDQREQAVDKAALSLIELLQFLFFAELL